MNKLKLIVLFSLLLTGSVQAESIDIEVLSVEYCKKFREGATVNVDNNIPDPSSGKTEMATSFDVTISEMVKCKKYFANLTELRQTIQDVNSDTDTELGRTDDVLQNNNVISLESFKEEMAYELALFEEKYFSQKKIEIENYVQKINYEARQLARNSNTVRNTVTAAVNQTADVASNRVQTKKEAPLFLLQGTFRQSGTEYYIIKSFDQLITLKEGDSFKGKKLLKNPKGLYFDDYRIIQ